MTRVPTKKQYERPRLLDLFCGAGGAAMGYHRAGFEVVGVDIEPHLEYPFEFHQADALDVLDALLPDGRGGSWCLSDFDTIHASPPCQRYSSCASLHPANEYSDLYLPVLERLKMSGLPYVVENVIGAPYRTGVVLCGSMFGMPIRRHRNFESNVAMLAPECRHSEQGELVGIYGNSDGEHKPGFKHPGVKRGPRQATTAEARRVMEMPWASRRREITEAIPPCFTQFIGGYLISHLDARVAT